MTLLGIVGRVLLGLFFLVPGIMKALDPAAGMEIMVAREVPFMVPLYWASVVIEIVFGAMLIIGYREVIAALVLAALTMAINVGVHNFWAVPEEIVMTELQLFIKNTAILGGLLVAAAWGYSKR
ncbi:DoxX family protein [Pyruvatibacter sp.]|uniref:DoxX family protein n=1 Tax=Pyruvatibacter sp. TaxID=1981328 RepID=UPI0032ED8CC9